MSVNPDVLIDAKLAESSQTTQYTSTGVTTLVDKFTVTNDTGTARTLAVNIVVSGGSAGASNIVVPAKTVDAGKTELLPEMIGQILGPGDFISTIASAASALVIRASGRRVT